MDFLDWPLKFIIAFALGAVIGLEREINEQKNIKGDDKGKHAILGLRSFSLVAGLGAIVGALYGNFQIMAALITGGFLTMLTMFYYLDSKFTVDNGITTEISFLYSFLLGFLVFTELLPMQLVVAITVVLVLLMSRKEDIKGLIQNIQQKEINALVSFGILALVILPFLPDETYALSDFSGLREFFQKVGWNVSQIIDLELINPFKLWMIVVLITGVDLLGYILERTIGTKKGWLVASLVGGFVSSTATTISIAQESKTTKNINPLVAGAVLASLVSFFPIGMILASFNVNLFIAFLPVLISIIVAALIVGVFFLKSAPAKKDEKKDEQKSKDSGSIFSLTSALRFMGIYLLINIVSKIALEFFGTGGFLATTALGSLTGVDAVVVNTAQLTGNRIDTTLGVWALILANAVNLLAKSSYSFLQGSKEFAIKFLVAMIIIIGVSLIPGLFSFI